MKNDLKKIQELYNNLCDSGLDCNSKEFSILIESIMPKCRIYIKNIMRGYSDDEVNDILSDSLEHIYLGIRSYNKKCPFLLWSYRICKNRFCSYYRMTRNNRFIGMDSYENTIGCDDFGSAFDLYRILPEDDSRNMFLKQVSGASLKEISDETGMNLNTVKVRLFRYKQKAKKILEDEFE